MHSHSECEHAGNGPDQVLHDDGPRKVSWALQGPVVQWKQGTPWMLKVTQFDRVARDVAAPEAQLGRCNRRIPATVNRS
jgi:hypothetical protein